MYLLLSRENLNLNLLYLPVLHVQRAWNMLAALRQSFNSYYIFYRITRSICFVIITRCILINFKTRYTLRIEIYTSVVGEASWY